MIRLGTFRSPDNRHHEAIHAPRRLANFSFPGCPVVDEIPDKIVLAWNFRCVNAVEHKIEICIATEAIDGPEHRVKNDEFPGLSDAVLRESSFANGKSARLKNTKYDCQVVSFIRH